MSITKKLLQAASGNAGGDNLYVEDVFSTYLYEGNSSTQTITNGIDLAGEGGLVWIKSRDTDYDHAAYDTEGGVTKNLYPNLTNGRGTESGVTAFNSNGFTLGSWGPNNNSANDFVSWTFRKAEKFFDVQTWTGNGVAGRQIPHSLGSTPGFIITKRTDSADNWKSYHVGNPSPAEDHVIELDNSNAAGNESIWNDTAPTSTNFTVSAGGAINANSYTYVAYLFASDAGGFGEDGSENIIKCGSYTGNGNTDGPTVTLGFEPQWLMIRGTGGGDWTIFDNMRGLSVGENDARIWANQSSAENDGYPYIDLQATGFKLQGSTGGAANGSGSNYIYIAIRRPMKTPEAGTEVFALEDPGYPLGSNGLAYTSGFPVDLALLKERTSSSDGWYTMSRMQGSGRYMKTNLTNAETSGVSNGTFDHNTGWYKTTNASMSWMFKRAPGFMDVVAYTGNGASSHALTHNLGVSPELIITKRRDASGDWRTATNFSASAYSLYKVNEVDPATNINYAAYAMYAAKPTSTTFTVGSGANVNASSGTYVSYLFGTVAGVSKVGSVVHSGTTNVDCGFSAGARFVMAKRADQNSGWFIWDSVRGIVAGNDPYMLLNSAAAEVTNTDYIDPLSSGFTLTSSFTSGTYIFLAIA